MKKLKKSIGAFRATYDHGDMKEEEILKEWPKCLKCGTNTVVDIRDEAEVKRRLKYLESQMSPINAIALFGDCSTCGTSKTMVIEGPGGRIQ